jgi:hypothetical protein
LNWDDTVVGHGAAQGGIKALEQSRDCFAGTAHERDTRLLAYCSRRSPPYRGDLADRSNS